MLNVHKFTVNAGYISTFQLQLLEMLGFKKIEEEGTQKK